MPPATEENTRRPKSPPDVEEALLWLHWERIFEAPVEHQQTLVTCYRGVYAKLMLAHFKLQRGWLPTVEAQAAELGAVIESAAKVAAWIDRLSGYDIDGNKRPLVARSHAAV